MKRPPKDLWFNPGLYDEVERVNDKVRVRKSSTLEFNSMHVLDKFIYFIPYVPLLVCPDAPDFVAEYCGEHNTDVDLIQFDGNYQLLPNFVKANIDTSAIFAMDKMVGLSVLNLARGIIVQDEKQKLFFRFRVQKLRIVPPNIRMSQSAEKIVESMIDLYSISVQSHEAYYFCSVDTPPNKLLFCRRNEKDTELTKMMDLFWKNESEII